MHLAARPRGWAVQRAGRASGAAVTEAEQRAHNETLHEAGRTGGQVEASVAISSSGMAAGRALSADGLRSEATEESDATAPRLGFIGKPAPSPAAAAAGGVSDALLLG